MTDPGDLFRRAESMPYGSAKTALLEEVVRRADAASDLPFEARMELVEAYVYGGERRRSLVPFTWCVAEYDKDPHRYQGHTHTLLWYFKYAPGTLTRFPEVPLDHTLAVLDDMERRWRTGGHSMHAVHQHRWLVAHHIGDAATAAEQYRLWSAAPRDDLSDCIGCDPTGKVTHLVSTGRYAEAVALATPVLDGSLSCFEQPQQILTALLPAYVQTGRHTEAAEAHRKAYRKLRSHHADLEDIAAHVVFCARTGNEARALELVEHHLRWLDAPPTTYAEMEFAAAASLVLRRLGSTVTVRGTSPEELANRATTLADRFDARNGTEYQSERIAAMLWAEPWVEFLPLSETARRAHHRRTRKTAPEATPAPVGGLTGLTGDALLEHAEECWLAEDEAGAVAAWQAFEASVPESARTAVQRGRVLDGAGLRVVDAEDQSAALETWREALSAYAEAGDELRQRRVRARIGRLLCELGEVGEGVSTGEEPARWLIENDDPRRRTAWRFALVLMLLVSQRQEEAERLVAEMRDGSGPAALLHGDLLGEFDRLDEAEAAYTEAIEAGEWPGLAMALWRRGRLRLAVERDAVEDLVEAVAIFGANGDTEQAAFARVDLAAAYLRTGRPSDAAEAAEEALPTVGRRARFVLADAYRALDDAAAALEQVQELAGSEEDRALLADLREQEGLLLEQLDRDDEAVAVLTAAADLYDDPLDRVRALRLAARSAGYADRHDEASTLRRTAAALLDGMPGDEDGVAFHRAGLDYDLALAARASDRTADAIRHAADAARRYADAGYQQQAADAVLMQAELGGPVGETELRPIFDAAEPGSDDWYRVGYLLLYSLERDGRDLDSTALRNRLEER